MDAREGLSTVFDKLHELLRTETVVGKPIVVGNVSIIPIIGITVGAGSGTGSGSDQAGNHGDGGGGMGGGRVTPSAIVVIKGDDVTVVPLTGRGGSLEKIAELVPDIISQLKPKEGKDDKKKEEDSSGKSDDKKDKERDHQHQH